MGRHGTCGLGIGETVGDSLEHPGEALRANDLTNTAVLRSKLTAARERLRPQMAPFLPFVGTQVAADLTVFEDPSMLDRTVECFREIGTKLHIIDATEANFQIRESEHVIFEGAQGVLLDEWHGFHPHTTWSTTTTRNADEMILRAGRGGPVNRIGVVRAYATRHGQGPFPTEDWMLTARLRDTHNIDLGWQGGFRVGWFDVPLTRYALSAWPGIDALAVTCLDRLGEVDEWSICQMYDRDIKLCSKPGDLQHQGQLTQALSSARPVLKQIASAPEEYVRVIEESLGLPVTITSFGPTAEDKRWR
jgi:adenylosuccinate synthase